MMNKILLDNEKVFLNDNSLNYLYVDSDKKVDLIVNHQSSAKLVIVAKGNLDLYIHLLENSSLLVNSLNKDNSVNVNIYLEQNSVVTYNHSVLSSIDSLNHFCINHLAANTTSIINNYGINRKNNKLFFQVDGIIPKKLHAITCNQTSKIINFQNGESKIIPNLIVDSNDIIANHSAYVGEIDEVTKFYLASRGISDKEIEKLIYKAILLGKMELSTEKEEFNNLINEWW